MKNVKSYAPAFCGFYESMLSMDIDCEIEHVNNEREENGLSSVEWDDFIEDDKGYKNAVADNFCYWLNHEFKHYGFFDDIVFESVYSPKYYNFTTDSINCEYVNINSDKISAFVYEHKAEYVQYLKDTYTSCDGFYSAHSNDFEEWELLTNNFKFDDDKEYSHYFGSVMEFIYSVLFNDDTTNNIESRVLENVYVSEYFYLPNDFDDDKTDSE